MKLRGSILLASLLGLCVASSAAAEIYRWTDANGREPFTTNLQQVPAEQRESAQEAVKRAQDRINHYTAPAPRRDAPAKAGDSAAPRSEATPDWSCDRVRREARKLRKTITYHRKRVDRFGRRADDITASAYSRRRNELRGEESAAWLAKAEAAFERFAREQRIRGVPPGCLRP